MTKAMEKRISRLENRLEPEKESKATLELVERLYEAKRRMARFNGLPEPAWPGTSPQPPKIRPLSHAQQMVEILIAGRTRMNDAHKRELEEAALQIIKINRE